MAASLAYAPLVLPPAYRRYYSNEGTIGYKSANKLQIDQDGLLLGLLVRFEGSLVTGATAPTFANASAPYPYNGPGLLSVQVAGPGTPVQLYGEDLDQYVRTLNPQYTDDTAQIPTTFAASTTYPLSFGYYIPICVRDDEFLGPPADHLGAIYTGDGKVKVLVGIGTQDFATTWFGATAADATISGEWVVTGVKLAAPDPSDDASLLGAISWYHALEIDTDATIASVGQQTHKPVINTPRAYLRIFDIFRNGGVTAAGPASAAYTRGMMATLLAKAEGIITWWDTLDEDTVLAIMSQAYRKTPGAPGGIYILDLNRSGSRDQWLDVSQLTSLTLIESMVAGTTLTEARYVTFTEYVQPSPLAQRWFNAASPQVLKAVESA